MRKEKESDAEKRWAQQHERGFVTPESTTPSAFIEWWKGHDHCPQVCTSRDGVQGYSSGITAHKAWQCECYRLEFEERKHEYAAGTGINYVWYGWHRAEDAPRTSNPAILEAHREWCRKHGRPDPAATRPLPESIRNVTDFARGKKVIKALADKMDMNKAIGWTQADSDVAEGEQPF
jgi:hypothetical protein